MNISIPEVIQDLIINIINIIILFVIVRSLVYKPVRKFLDARTARIDALQAQAAEQLQAAQARAAQVDEELKAGRTRAEEVLSEAEHTAKLNAGKIVEEARSDARKILEKARQDTKAEHNEMISSLKDEIMQLAAGMAEKILEREISDDDNMRLAAQFFSECNGTADSMLKQTARRIAAGQKSAYDAEKEDIAEIAVDVSGKILSHSVTDEDNLNIAKEFFDELEQQKQGDPD